MNIYIFIDLPIVLKHSMYDLLEVLKNVRFISSVALIRDFADIPITDIG